MTNFQVYRKTISYSFVMLCCDLLSLILVIGLSVAGFYIGASMGDSQALIGLAIGLILGIIAGVLVGYLLTNRVKAAQIAMMTKGVTENALPDHVFHEGFNELKGRFAKITLFFFVVNTIKRIFRRIGRTFTRVGQAVGGKVGGGIASAIDSAIQTVIAYLADCCLGWALFRKDKGVGSAACEGATIFFKHGKTLVKNIGRIFGIGIASFVLIGGAFFGILYLIFTQIPQVFTALSEAIIDAGAADTDAISDPKTLLLIIAAVIAIVLWSFIHKVLIRPFILVGVLRNFMEAGQAHIPTEQEMDEVDNKIPGFRKLRDRTE